MFGLAVATPLVSRSRPAARSQSQPSIGALVASRNPTAPTGVAGPDVLKKTVALRELVVRVIMILVLVIALAVLAVGLSTVGALCRRAASGEHRHATALGTTYRSAASCG